MNLAAMNPGKGVVMKIALVLLLFWGPLLTAMQAQAGTQGGTQTTLAELRRLVFIADDLHDKTQVTLSGDPTSPNKSDACFCSCRDQQWSCTYTECKLQEKKCGEVDKH
jgi:hypothetical protein